MFFRQTKLFVTNKQRLSHPKKCKLGFNGNLNLIYKLAVLPPYYFGSLTKNGKGVFPKHTQDEKDFSGYQGGTIGHNLRGFTFYQKEIPKS